MNKIIIDVDGYRCTVCGAKWFPELVLDCIVCPKCGAVRKIQSCHDDEQGADPGSEHAETSDGSHRVDL